MAPSPRPRFDPPGSVQHLGARQRLRSAWGVRRFTLPSIAFVVGLVVDATYISRAGVYGASSHRG
jgi:hypothetical protein